MHVLSWLDNRTLFSCQFLLAAVFSVVFFNMRRTYPAFRGIGSVTISFLLGVPGVLLLYMRGIVPDLLSPTIAGVLILASFTLFYRGLLQFLGDNQSLSLLLMVDAIAFAFICFFGQVRHNIIPAIAAVSIVVALIRGLTAFKLLQHAHGRVHMRLFGLMMSLFVLNSISRAVYTVLHGAPVNYLERSTTESLPLAVNLLYLCLTGLFFMSMVNNRVLAFVRSESEQDPLTGILNRRGVELRLKAEAKRSQRNGSPLSIALIDIDYFKSINDTAGHAAGDNAICQIASTISSCLRAYDCFGRLGGDEFLLILPQTTGSNAVTVLDRVTQATRALRWSDSNLPITLSVGLTEASSGESLAAMLARADKALYAAKHAGRDCSRLFLRDSQMESIHLDSALFVS